MMQSAQRDRVQLLLRTARYCYEDELNQDQIARRIGYSRSFVSRLLAEARAKGMVRFVIEHPLERQMELEHDLITRFGLRNARVTESGAPHASLLAVAKVGADLVAEAAKGVTVLATSAGTTIDALVHELPSLNLRDLTVVQMIGSLARGNPLVDSAEITRRIAEKLGAEYRPMPAPLIVRTKRLAAALKREEAVATAIALASHADVALLGIGAMDVRGVSGPIFRGWLTVEESQRLVELGAVGHISGQHFDAEGRQILSDVSERVISVPLAQLSGIGTVIGVATGQDKVAATLGALRGSYLDVLVTDEATAGAVLRQG